jgi:N-acetylmuramidase
MAKTLTLAEYCSSAKNNSVEVEKIMAVASVESNGGGFLPSGKIKILFERHKFSKYLSPEKRADYSKRFPQICSKTAGGYYGGEREYIRFSQAFNLDPHAALMATSFGAFQCMGFNYESLGFETVNEMVDYLKTGEAAQLEVFIRYMKTNKLFGALRAGNWPVVAKGYNGEDYERNNYDGKMSSSYSRFKKQNLNCAKALAAAPAFATATMTNALHPALEATDYSRDVVSPPTDMDDDWPDVIGAPVEETPNQDMGLAGEDPPAPGAGDNAEDPARHSINYVDYLPMTLKWIKRVAQGSIFTSLLGGTGLGMASFAGFNLNLNIVATVAIALVALFVVLFAFLGFLAACFVVYKMVMKWKEGTLRADTTLQNIEFCARKVRSLSEALRA